MTKRLLAYLPAALWAVGLWLLGGRNDLPGLELQLGVDKLLHFLLYAVLGVLLALGWQHAGRLPAWPITLALGLLVGALDELHQARVPGRHADVADWLADAAGCAAAFALTARYARLRRGADAA